MASTTHSPNVRSSGSLDCVFRGNASICGLGDPVCPMSSTLDWIMTLQDSNSQPERESSFRHMCIGLIVMSSINILAALVLIAHSYRRTIRETGRLKLLIKVRRPEKNFYIFPPIWVLWPGILLLGLYHLAWCIYIWHAWNDGVPTLSSTIIKSTVWIAAYMIVWYFIDANFFVTVLAADIWDLMPARRKHIWLTALAPWILVAAWVPMLVVASVANNTLEEYAKELSTTVDSAAGAIISGPQVQHLDDLIDRARRLALGLQVLLLVSLAGLFVHCSLDLHFVYSALSLRCEKLLNGHDAEPRPQPHPIDLDLRIEQQQSDDPAFDALTGADRKVGNFLKGAGIQQVPSSPVPKEKDEDAMRNVVLAQTAATGTWAIQPIQQHKLKVLKSIRRSHCTTTSILLAGSLACLVYSIYTLVQQWSGNILGRFDTASFTPPYIIAGALLLIEIWAIASLMGLRRDSTTEGPAISAVAAHEPIAITVQRPALWPNGRPVPSSAEVPTMGQLEIGIATRQKYQGSL